MKNIWLDVDPGHDDAIALMLAVHCPDINLLGVSTCHGNAPSSHTTLNAARCLYAYGAPAEIKVYPGASKPLILPAKHDPQIHGKDGLGGVEGLPGGEHPGVQERFVYDEGGKFKIRALDAMNQAIRKIWKVGKGEKVTVVSSGPMTNIALFISVYPELVDPVNGAIEEFVFMGGGVGMGNRSSVAEYNIMTDPHATQIVLDSPVKTTMIPINVTHKAIATKEVIYRLLTNSNFPASEPTITPKAITPLRHTLYTLLTFFAAAYESTFDFKLGPPLHDALTIAYLQSPELFKGKRYRVDTELSPGFCLGETVVDMWRYRDPNLDLNENCWGMRGRNCVVIQEMDVPKFFDLFMECVEKCDVVSPLNQ